MIQDAKKVLMECATQRKIMEGKDQSLIPCVQYVLEHDVRLIVGERYWLRSKKYFIGYKHRHLRQNVHRV
jgi:hypothetical protein